mgnify:CR=1 FL=1
MLKKQAQWRENFAVDIVFDFKNDSSGQLWRRSKYQHFKADALSLISSGFSAGLVCMFNQTVIPVICTATGVEVCTHQQKKMKKKVCLLVICHDHGEKILFFL